VSLSRASIRPLLASTVLLAMSGFAPAADLEGRYALKGLGAASCEQFLIAEAERSEAYQGFVGWLDGFTTAINAVAGNTFDAAGWRSSELVAQIIKRNCAERPQLAFGVIAERVHRRLLPLGLRSASELVAVDNGQERFLLYRATIESLQRRLRQSGFAEVEVTANYDDATRAALSRFQERSALPVSGLPDQVTLWRLFSDEPGASP
jgi:hypothetical protein